MTSQYLFKTADSVLYTEWIHRKSWTLKEAASLLAGYEPGKPLGMRPIDALLFDPKVSDTVERYESALQASVDQEQCAAKMSPLDWITIAQQRGIPVSPELSKFFPKGRDIFRRCDELERELSLCRTENASLLKSGQDVASQDKPLSAKERDNQMRVIGVLLRVIFGDLPKIRSHPDITNQAELIGIIERNFKGIAGGLSKSHLGRLFPAAMDKLAEN